MISKVMAVKANRKDLWKVHLKNLKFLTDVGCLQWCKTKKYRNENMAIDKTEGDDQPHFN